MSLAAMDSRLIQILLVVALVAGVKSQGTNTNQTEAQEFLDLYNAEAQQVFFTNMLLNWVYQTNVTDENRENMVRPCLFGRMLLLLVCCCHCQIHSIIVL